MCFIPLALWISNAAARFSGNRGAVSIQARRVGCSRQAIYDQARKVHGAVQAEYSGGPTREVLIRENQALRCENAQLWDWVDRAVEFTLAKQQKFSALGACLSISIQVTSMDDQSVQVASIRPQCLFAPIPAA